MKIPRIMIAAPASGSGKTTVTCAVLSLLKEMGQKPVAFKCGPDYIDPMFHQTVLQTPSHNLDIFLCGRGDVGRQWIQHLLVAYGKDTDIAVLEGAMGYYDGMGTTWENSAYDIAKTTDTPVILVLNGKGAAISLAAQLHGFQTFQPDSHIAGFIVNNVKKGVYQYFKEAIEDVTGLKGLGYVPPLPEAALPSRHLGLVTAAEIPDIQQKIALLRDTIQETIDMQAIQEIAATAPDIEDSFLTPPVALGQVTEDVTIAVARDEAFCFYYEASLHILQALGADLVFFSPLHDGHLPPCQGLYLGGGYPELHALDLARNVSIRDDIRNALAQNIPCIAECGGFMYLQEGFIDGDTMYPWVGTLPGMTHMTKSLTRFGYVTITAEGENAFLQKGQHIHGHEFHYSDSTQNGDAFLIEKPTGKRHWQGGYAQGNLLAGYPHIHFCGCLDVAARFIQACKRWNDIGRTYENRTHFTPRH